MLDGQQLPPAIPSVLSDGDRALIAGWIVVQRAGTLVALEKAMQSREYDVPWWADPMVSYWSAVERIERMWLHFLGYEVQENANWKPP